MNGLEKEFEGKAEVVRVNLGSEMGKQIARQYGVTSAGTIMLDGSGEVVYNHKGFPERKKIRAMVANQ